MSTVTEMPVDKVDTNRTINWRHVGAFLILTFGLTFLLDLAIYLRGGLSAPGIAPVMQLQMLLPAFSAIFLGLFFFPESPIYRRRDAGRGRWFYYYFLAMTILMAVAAVVMWFYPSKSSIAIFSSMSLLLSLLGLFLLIVLRFVAGRDAMDRVWLSWGNWRYWLTFGAAIIAFYILQVALNAITGLGGTQVVPIAGVQGMDPLLLTIVAAVQTVLLGPFLGLVITFGEEYGWRGYLQTELLKMGRVRGTLLLGVIWGVWHWPLILMGYNYPGRPLLGVVLMTLYTIGLGIVLGYAVLKSGSILLASFVHALNNQFLAFIFVMGFKPHDIAFSFGIGIYGVVTLAIVAFLILRDPIWRGKGNSLRE